MRFYVSDKSTGNLICIFQIGEKNIVYKSFIHKIWWVLFLTVRKLNVYCNIRAWDVVYHKVNSGFVNRNSGICLAKYFVIYKISTNYNIQICWACILQSVRFLLIAKLEFDKYSIFPAINPFSIRIIDVNRQISGIWLIVNIINDIGSIGSKNQMLLNILLLATLLDKDWNYILLSMKSSSIVMLRYSKYCMLQSSKFLLLVIEKFNKYLKLKNL